jgi:hypothetical protein
MYQNVMDVFGEAGVEIMSPNYQAFRDGSKPAMPEENLSENDRTPTVCAGGNQRGRKVKEH